MTAKSMVHTFPMIINGKEVPGTSNELIDVINPSTEEVIGRVVAATDGEIDSAARSAFEAFRQWRETPAAERAAVMMKLVHLLRQESEEIARTLTLEVGKPLPQAQGEVGIFCSLLEFFSQEARRISGMVLESDHRDRFVYVLREPVGVVAAITPWNDPLFLLARMIGPAFAAGCTAVVKPSSQTPLATILMSRAAVEAGFPPGLLNVVTGPGSRVGEGLVRHPLVRKASLTGSVEGGREVMKAAAEGIKRVTLELGGQCPCIVWSDGDLDKAAAAITFQAFRSSGQVCNRVNRVYAHRRIYDELAGRVAELASRIVAGDGFREGVDIGPLNNRRQLEWVTSQVEDAVARGAKLLAGGRRIGEKGFFFEPTVLGACTHEMGVMKEETFGPVLAFMRVDDDFEKVLEFANNTIFGLSAYLFSSDTRRCHLAARRLEAGSIWINDIHGSMLQAPYGGIKQSGMGREQGSVAVEEYLEWKTVYQELSPEPRGARLCVHPEGGR
ncbi:MAG TPA: NAD-dependent succinate-semialdehyde dehydrogenase [Spirochaetia bacterium]|nr:NAD-dependent succinate-semialdehyde dehydrogenase [Spirochaetia bacterium]